MGGMALMARAVVGGRLSRPQTFVMHNPVKMVEVIGRITHQMLHHQSPHLLHTPSFPAIHQPNQLWPPLSPTRKHRSRPSAPQTKSTTTTPPLPPSQKTYAPG